MTTLIEDIVILSPANDGGSLACEVIVCTMVQRCGVFGLEYVLAVRLFVLVVLLECCVFSKRATLGTLCVGCAAAQQCAQCTQDYTTATAPLLAYSFMQSRCLSLQYYGFLKLSHYSTLQYTVCKLYGVGT
jgi:hypothetical protein